MRKIKDYRYQYPDDQRYWLCEDLERLLAHNADITIVTSPRNVGKTYAGMTKTAKIIEKGDSVVWERWNKPALGMTIQTIKQRFPDMKISATEAGTGKIFEDECTGGKIYAIPYNLADNVKGIDDPTLILEFKDEFIPLIYDNKTRRDNEFKVATNVRTSLKRDGPMRSVYFANCIAWQNPYCLNWEIGPIDTGVTRKFIDRWNIKVRGKEHTHERTIVWENLEMTSAMIDRCMESDMVGMTEAELVSYYDNATNVEYTKIEKCPDPTVQLEPIQLMSEGYYMGYRRYNDYLYFTQVKPRFDIATYVSEPVYIDVAKNHYRYPALGTQYEQNFNSARCIFDSAKTIMAFQRWLWHLRQRI